MEAIRVPVRLVVCVDGTWFGPDGIYSGWAGNTSSIFRIWSCIKEGEVKDFNGKQWRQERVYVKGIDSPSNWTDRLLSGAFGHGVAEQIKEIYKLCCDKASNAEDEVFFFGFSRGAFVVRAVANLLAYMRIARPMTEGEHFEDTYKRMLELYQDVRAGNDKRAGSIHEYMSRSTASPQLRFVGVIDTVKAYEDGGLYDVGLHPALRCCRQALALNEEKADFTPDLWLAKEEADVVEAWFLGSHGDLGGGNAQDGLALYPCQWLLAEARTQGLELSFDSVTYSTALLRDKKTIDNPLELCFPINDDPEGNSLTHVLSCSNGIQTLMWDMTAIHKRKGYELRINQRPNSWIFTTAPRTIFNESLIGFHETTSFGVLIHPSAYYLHDTDNRLSSAAAAWSFHDGFVDFRRHALADDKAVFWQQTVTEPIVLDNTKFRLLVCGDAGVGKSTLINLLLGVPNMVSQAKSFDFISHGQTQESDTQHGVHDIEQGFSPEHAKYIVHDSCGFQSGQRDEIEQVEKFLVQRLAADDFAERLHAIVYCIASTRIRTTESADRDFFETLRKLDTTVPVVVVATRADELEALSTNRIETEYMERHTKKSRRHLTPEDWDEIDALVKAAMDERKSVLVSDFTELRFPFAGPVFTSKQNPESITEVVSVIANALTDERLRAMFVAAQVCSVQPKIDYALSNSINLYRRAVQTAALPIAWSGLLASSTANVLIVQDTLKTFGFDSYSSEMASHIISTSLVSNYQSNGIYLTGTAVNAAAAAAIGTGIGAVAGAALGTAWYAWKLVAIPQFGRMLLMCTVDTILIMEIVFWQVGLQNPRDEDIKTACAIYQRKVERVHNDVKALLGIWDSIKVFQFEKLKLEINAVIERHRYHGKSTVDGADGQP